MAQQNRVKFGSKLGMILATAGGAVGRIIEPITKLPMWMVLWMERSMISLKPT